MTPTKTPKQRRGFAAMDPDQQKRIAALGGRAVRPEQRSFNDRSLAAAAGRKGGQASGGNFARDPARAAEMGRKGGQASPGNFGTAANAASVAGRKGGRVRAARAAARKAEGAGDGR